MSTSTLQSRFRVEGMDCASCAKKIDAAARRVDGVEDVSVSVTAGTMTVTHRPVADLSALSKRIESLGYKVSPAAAKSPTAASTGQVKTIANDHTGHDHLQGGHQNEHGDDHSDHDPAGHDHGDDKHDETEHRPGSQLSQSRYRVEGMDCASCAQKIDTAVRRIEGIEEVSVSVTAATMTVSHGADVNLSEIKKRVESLGYKVFPAPATKSNTAVGDASHEGHDHKDKKGVAGLHGHDHGNEEGPWWKSTKAKLTIVCGLALVAAFVVGKLLPAYETWAFIAAMAVGLIPIARRAVMAALNGSPFTIETLMTIAAVGAVVIDASEEAAAVVFLFLVGELLEGVAAGRARASIKALATLVPKTALVEDGGKTTEVPADSLAIG